MRRANGGGLGNFIKDMVGSAQDAVSAVIPVMSLAQ